MIGPDARVDRSWIVCATTSLPVPVSPSITTVVAVGAIFSSTVYSSRILTWRPTMRPSFSLRDGRISTFSSAAWNLTSVLPSPMVQPGLRYASLMRTRLMNVPLVEPRSTSR